MEKIDTDNQIMTETAEVPENVGGSETMTEESYGGNRLFSMQTLEDNLSDCLRILDDAVIHSYVTELGRLEVAEPEFDEEKMKNEPYQFVNISKLVYEQDEFSVSKLSSVFQALSGKRCTLVMIIRNVNRTANFYLGVRDHNESQMTGTLRQMLEMGFKGQFPGSDFNKNFSIEDIDKLTESVKRSSKAVSCVSCIPDFKQEKDFFENKDFMQGLEKFVISMQDHDYTAVFVAEAVPYEELSDYRSQLESVCTQLSPFANMQYQLGASDGNSDARTAQSGVSGTDTKGSSDTQGTSSSVTVGESSGTSVGKTETDSHSVNSSQTLGKSTGVNVTDGTSQSVADGTSDTKTKTVGGSISTGVMSTVGGSVGIGVGAKILGIGANVTAGLFKSIGKSLGFSINASSSRAHTTSHTVTEGTSHSVGISNTISNALTKGMSESKSIGSSNTATKTSSKSETDGTSSQHSENTSHSDSFSFSRAQTLTDTFGTSQGITMQLQNTMIANMIERIKKHIKRIEECESIGMWNCASYFLSENRAVSETAANIYRSLISGKNSDVERSAINTWTASEKSDVGNFRKIITYMVHFCHPKFAYASADGPCLVSPASLVSTKELALEMSLPKRSVSGLPVIEHAVFGQNIIRSDIIAEKTNKKDFIHIGKICHLNSVSETPVDLDLNSLTMHTFIAGSTGAGKSNTTYVMLDELSKYNIPYLVIEPAKGEYKTQFKDANVFGTNPRLGPILRLNPFSFPEEVHVQEHIDRLAELFNVCWEMYAAMPAVLKDAIIRAYESAGWDMNNSVNRFGNALFPNFEDVLREIDSVVSDSDYSSDTGSDYRGALKTRLRSLTNGLNGMIFSSREIPCEKLFDSKTVVDLSRVGSTETKALMMGVLVLKLQEHRMSHAKKADSALRHVTVLEEAHNLLKRTSTEQGQETANLQGKSVEMLTNAIAEMRTYGEGFIIVDQSPGALDPAVIRNTNTKIIMRLPEYSDRESTGASMALNENQIKELSKLPQGVAAVYQNNWQEAVLCAVKKRQFVDLPALAANKEADDGYDEKQTLELLLCEERLTPKLTEALNVSSAPAKIRKTLIENFENKNDEYQWAMADYIAGRFDWGCALKGTGACGSTEEIRDLMISNLARLFEGFDEEKLSRICRYICMKAHEVYPENEVIEEVMTKHFMKG